MQVMQRTLLASRHMDDLTSQRAVSSLSSYHVYKQPALKKELYFPGIWLIVNPCDLKTDRNSLWWGKTIWSSIYNQSACGNRRAHDERDAAFNCADTASPVSSNAMIERCR